MDEKIDELKNKKNIELDVVDDMDCISKYEYEFDFAASEQLKSSILMYEEITKRVRIIISGYKKYLILHFLHNILIRPHCDSEIVYWYINYEVNLSNFSIFFLSVRKNYCLNQKQVQHIQSKYHKNFKLIKINNRY